MTKYDYSDKVFSDFFSLRDKGFLIREICVKMNIATNQGFFLSQKYNDFKFKSNPAEKYAPAENKLIEPAGNSKISYSHLLLSERIKMVSKLEKEIFECKDVEKSKKLFTKMKNISI